MTPKAFIHKIHEICRADLQNIVLPEVRGARLNGADLLLLIACLGGKMLLPTCRREYNFAVSGCGGHLSSVFLGGLACSRWCVLSHTARSLCCAGTHAANAHPASPAPFRPSLANSPPTAVCWPLLPRL